MTIGGWNCLSVVVAVNIYVAATWILSAFG